MSAIIESAIPAVKKTDLRSEVTSILRGLIIKGTLAPGTRLVEREIARMINVSRTPMREAFFELEREGLIEKVGERGLAVSGLSRKEIEEIYPLIAVLEKLLIEQLPTVSNRMLAKLKKANERFSMIRGSPEKLIDRDFDWHQIVVAESPNIKALKILSDLKKIAERYERAFFKKPGNIEKSIKEHRLIERELAAGNIIQAAMLVESHWLESMVFLVNALSGDRRGKP